MLFVRLGSNTCSFTPTINPRSPRNMPYTQEYCVLSTQNDTFQRFASTLETSQKMFPGQVWGCILDGLWHLDLYFGQPFCNFSLCFWLRKYGVVLYGFKWLDFFPRVAPGLGRGSPGAPQHYYFKRFFFFF